MAGCVLGQLKPSGLSFLICEKGRNNRLSVQYRTISESVISD